MTCAKGLTDEDCDCLRNLLVGQGRAWIFGSRAWGEPQRYSDIDVALEVRPEGLGAMEALRERFEASRLPYIVDLSVLEDLPGSWQERIKAQGILLQKE